MIEQTDKVILLTVDALRYDVVDEEIVHTPNIDRIRSEGLDFERAFSNGFGTPYVFPAILYGKRKNEGKGAPDSESVAEKFSRKGYETIGLTSNPFTSSYYGYDKGFDRFEDFVQPTEEKEKNIIFKLGRKFVKKFDFLYDRITSLTTKFSLPYERAGQMNTEILERLDSEKKQFFWAHYMDPHAPYSPPEEYVEDREAWKKRGKLTSKLYSGEITEEQSEMLWTLYKAEVKYLDDKIGELLSELDEELDDYTIIFAADHGEEFGERGQHQHGQFFEFNIHIPLTFYQKTKEGERRQDIATQLDILPTLSSIYGFETEGLEGINLLEETQESFQITFQDSFIHITDEWKLIDRPDEKYLFDISKTLKETENLYEERPEIVKKLEKEDELDLDI